MSDYVDERNRARERIMRILSDGEWHSLADMTRGDREQPNVYVAVLHRLVKDRKVEHYKSAWIDGVQRPGYRLVTSTTTPRVSRQSHSPGATRAAILDLLSDGRWYTHSAMFVKLPAYAHRTIEDNVSRLRQEGIIVSRTIPRTRHGPSLAFALAEAVE